jgi:hypothetical protein
MLRRDLSRYLDISVSTFGDPDSALDEAKDKWTSAFHFQGSAEVASGEGTHSAHINKQTIQAGELFGDPSGHHYEGNLIVRQMERDLPHALRLDAASVAAEPFRYFKIKADYPDTNNLQASITPANLLPAPTLITDAFSLATLKGLGADAGNPQIYAFPVSENEGLSFAQGARATTMQAYIRHRPTAQYLNDLYNFTYTASPRLFSLTPSDPIILVLFRSARLINFGEILQPQQIASFPEEWWILVITWPSSTFTTYPFSLT